MDATAATLTGSGLRRRDLADSASNGGPAAHAAIRNEGLTRATRRGHLEFVISSGGLRATPYGWRDGQAIREGLYQESHRNRVQPRVPCGRQGQAGRQDLLRKEHGG